MTQSKKKHPILFSLAFYTTFVWLFPFVCVSYIFGNIFYAIGKVLTALGHLLMGNIHSAKDEITDFRIKISLGDLK